MPVPSPKPSVVSRPHDVRRLRDLLRAGVAGGHFPGGRMPGEGELMVAFGASRSTVREAVALLLAEGVVRPLDAPGTYGAVGPRPRNRPVATAPDGTARTRLLDRTGIAAPAPLAAWLGVPAGAPCLRIEFVTDVDGAPSAVSTHYVLQPQAVELLGIPMRGDWDTLLDDAALPRGTVELEVDHLPADPAVADLLGVRPGTLLLAADQTTADPDGRVFDAAVVRKRAGARRPGGAPDERRSARPVAG